MKPSSFSNASWIASSITGGPRTSARTPYFRRTFSLDGPVRSAVLSITALGLYEAEINGKTIGDQIFAPGWTDYRKRVHFQQWDVTGLLSQGENTVGAILGDGWYCGFLAWKGRQIYGDRPKLLAQLNITLEDGKTVAIATDGTWKTGTGPILENDLLMGESYDARIESGSWSAPDFDESGWQSVVLAEDPGIAVETTAAPPVRRITEIAPASQKRIGGGWIFDFGQNFSGRVRITTSAERGRTLTIRHAEVLNPDGTIYTENLRAAICTDHYITRGGEPETWEPRFTFHGFRYAEITGLTDEDKVEAIGIVLHSDTPPTGSFSCSNPLLNQLQHNIIWGQKSNFLEVPTDCPQRDERLGWTGDAQVFIRTACFNMDVREFFHKWLESARDVQAPNGAVPAVIPDNGLLGMEDGGPAWADAHIICPWTIYLCYGDKAILEEHYESMQKFMGYLATHKCKGRIRVHPEVEPWGGFGDWLALDGSGSTEGGTPKDLIGTAFHAYDAWIMAKVARVLGREEDAAAYEVLRAEIVEAFRNRFLTPEGLVASGTQTALVLAIHFGLVPEEVLPTTVAELVRDIRKRDKHLATGFVGTPYLLDVLENHGHLDLAYELLEQETYPSWLFPVKNGATTIWERWDGWTPDRGFQSKGMNSFNHYAYGAVGAWMYRTVAGLDLDQENPGYKRVIFRPRPGGSITQAEAKLDTVFGEVSIRWELKGGTLDITMNVPSGATASFLPPAGYGAEAQSLESGTHHISLRKETSSSK